MPARLRLRLRGGCVVGLAACLAAAAASGCKRPPPKEYEQGVACLEQGDLAGAIVCFDEALRLAPRLADAHYRRGLAFYRRAQGSQKDRDLDAALLDNDRATFEFEMALGLDRSHKEAAALRDEAQSNALLYKREYDLDKAIQLQSEAIKTHPDKAEPYDRRGCAYVSRADFFDEPADYDRAIDDFGTAARLAPRYVQAWYNRATVLMIRGQQEHGSGDRHGAQGEDGRECYRRAVASYDRAVADFRRAAELDPAVAAARGAGADAGQYPEEDEDLLTTPYDGEVKDFEPSRIVCPRMVRAYYLRGDALCKLGEWDRALADLDEAIRLYPRFGEAFANRALAHEAKGEAQKAEADRAEARRLGSMFE